jgi:hypothetical protein
MLARYLTDNPDLLPSLIKIGGNEKDSTWRAFWIADHIHKQHPELIVPFLPEITEMALITKDRAKKRHLLKLISLNKIPEEKMGELLNFCAGRFADASEPVAVRVHAMQVLFNIAVEQPDFAGELIDLIEHEPEFHSSAGITSRGRKLLRKLKAIADTQAV